MPNCENKFTLFYWGEFEIWEVLPQLSVAGRFLELSICFGRVILDQKSGKRFRVRAMANAGCDQAGWFLNVYHLHHLSTIGQRQFVAFLGRIVKGHEILVFQQC